MGIDSWLGGAKHRRNGSGAPLRALGVEFKGDKENNAVKYADAPATEIHINTKLLGRVEHVDRVDAF